MTYILILTGCSQDRVFEQYVSLKNDEWFLSQRPNFYYEIKDTSARYNVYFNVRHTGNYNYSNLFVYFLLQGPKSPLEKKRLEFRLAEEDGKWLGSGLGDVYSNQIEILHEVKFQKPGVYSFGFEQNMRDNPLQGIEDVGVLIAKAK
jgi:gliding motility-associated lipoprotein GldH